MHNKKIGDILSTKEINDIDQRVNSGVDVFTILTTYKKYTEEDREIIKCYIKERFKLIFNNNRIMGHKNEAYYKNEEEMIIPKYTWDDLSEEEKEFYNQNKNQNG